MRAVAVAVVLLVCGLALLWSLQRRLVYFPFGSVPAPGDVGLDDVREVTFETADGLTLNGWLVSGGPSPLAAVIVFNGNAGNRAMRAGLAAALSHRGMSVLLFDYRGFGENGGTPGEEGLRLDARAARAFLLAQPAIGTSRVVYFGESLGTAVAVDLASEHPPSGLVLRSPFTSLADVGRYHYPWLPVSLLLRDRYATTERLGSLHVPTLVIAGDRDRIVPAQQSRQVYDSLPGPRSLLVIRGADHNDEALTEGRELLDGVERFVRALPARS